MLKTEIFYILLNGEIVVGKVAVLLHGEIVVGKLLLGKLVIGKIVVGEMGCRGSWLLGKLLSMKMSRGSCDWGLVICAGDLA